MEGVESHCEKQKVTHTGLGGKENQAPWRQREPGAVAELGGTVERGGSWGYSYHGSTMRNTSNISISVYLSICLSI